MMTNRIQIMRNISSLLRVTAGVILLVGLWSCGTTRPHAGKGVDASGGLTKREFVSRYADHKLPEGIEGRGQVYINAAGKEISSAIRMVLSPDRYFELSARPLGLIEVGRICIDARRGVLIIDRMNKQVLREEQVSEWSRTAEERLGFSPAILKALVQNEPFDFGRTGYGTLSSMQMDMEGGRYHFFHTRRGGDAIHHYFDGEGRLVESRVTVSGEGTVIARYTDFTVVASDGSGRSYPRLMELKATSINHRPGTYTIAMELSRVQTMDTTSDEMELTIPTGYRVITIDELLKALKAL